MPFFNFEERDDKVISTAGSLRDRLSPGSVFHRARTLKRREENVVKRVNSLMGLQLPKLVPPSSSG